jgi:hypothetical protein
MLFVPESVSKLAFCTRSPGQNDGVGVFVGVFVGVRVGVGVDVLGGLVGVFVGVFVGVIEGVIVGVFVRVFVGVLVGVEVGVGEGRQCIVQNEPPPMSLSNSREPYRTPPANENTTPPKNASLWNAQGGLFTVRVRDEFGGMTAWR